MAKKTYYDVQGPRSFVKVETGNFTCSGTGNPMVDSADNFTVERINQGHLKVTLPYSYPQVEAVQVSLETDGFADSQVAVSGTDNITSDGSFGVLTSTAGSAADFTTDEKIHFTVWARNISLAR